jgi:hypothetical protein
MKFTRTLNLFKEHNTSKRSCEAQTLDELDYEDQSLEVSDSTTQSPEVLTSS